MLKQLLILFFLFLNLYGGDKVEIYASTMDSNGSIVKATGGVSVIYKDYFLTADRATYNRESGDLELYGNVRVNQSSLYKVLGNYAKLNIAKKERLFQPFYMSDKKSRVWLSAQEGKTEDQDINLNAGVLSGCNPIDPIWKMEFSSSDYNAKTKWLNIYNTRLYIGDIPVFYTPYFGYSLDTKRRTGLLMPTVGYSDAEGFYYEQPIYIAEQNWWDLEFRPQLRTNRGEGIYQTFRFIESPKAKGEFKAGYFQEHDSYFAKSNLANNAHYGFNLNYENKDFLNDWFGTNYTGQSGMYVDATYMNDVDYINLSSNDITETATATQLLSRMNIFYNTKKNYIGTYFKYYQDLRLQSNTATLQKLPTLQYHHYLETFLDDHLLYNLDVQSNNIVRTQGTTVVQTDINLPITLQTSILDEYLNISYEANVYMQHSLFNNVEVNPSLNNDFRNGYVLRNYHTLSVSSQLTRGYEDISHVMSFGLSYNKAGSEYKNGYYEDNYEFCAESLNKDDPRCEFYSVTSINEEAQLDFIQYLYNDEAEEFLYHRLAQRISYGPASTKYGELENELDYKVTSYLSLYNNMFYNYEEQRFSKVFNKISIKASSVNFVFSHLYKDTFITATADAERYTSYLTTSIAYKYDSHYSFNALYNYDTIRQEAKSKEVGFLYQKRCWDFGIKYRENRRPILDVNNQASYIDDRYVYLTIILKPLMQADGGSLVTYRLPEKN